MKLRWSAIIFVFVVACGSARAQNNPSGPSEQTHFSAEDTAVKKPIVIPEEVLDILKKDGMVRDALEAQNLSADELPSSWFSGSAIHLSSADEQDLVVVGNAPLLGSNVTTFWVICLTARGPQLVLMAHAHNLVVKNTRWRGHRDVEVTAATALRVSTVLYRFDGKRYVASARETQDIQ
ncbi:MAG: hypothetical protein ACLP1Y_16750 [Candidatus Acidiferrales bacterium]